MIISHVEATLIGGNDYILADNYHGFASLAIEANFFAYNNENEPQYLNNILKFINRASAFKLNTEVTQNETNIEQIQIAQNIRRLENELLALEKEPNEEQKNKIEIELFENRKLAFELSFKNQSNNKINSENFSAEIKISDIQTNLIQNEAFTAYHLSETRLYSLFISKNEVKINSTEIDKKFTDLITEYYKNLKTASPNLTNSAKKLYSYLIFPFEKELTTIQKLIIIPDNELNQIPFEALVYKENNEDKFLIEKLSISYNYSAFLWTKSRKHEKNTENISFVGFAPVFLDGKTEIATYNPLNYNAGLQSEYREIKDGKYLKPLIYSEKEVLEIQKLFEAKGNKATIYTHNEASEQNFKENINNSSIIHIATHGYSSQKMPELSGLFFSKNTENTEKNITNDGFIYMDELYMLESNADLVVLSACKTGTGKIAKGEGILALPRAFIFVGIPNIVASLWKIHDEKTKNLMLDFYTHILDGKSYSEALRLAKLKQIENGELPIDWSGIILIGE